MRSSLPVTAAALVVALGLVGCAIPIHEPALHPPDEAPAQTKGIPVLKAHMKSGELYVLDTWRLGDDQMLRGEGTLYGIERSAGRRGQYSLALDSIALVETESTKNIHPAPLQFMAFLTTFWGAISAVCVADPKSCFGSCPTFYTEGEAAPDVPVAEGFSDSIARVLEARDVDALYGAHPWGSTFALRMRNEALETQAVRRVRLLAAPRPPGGRVFAGADGRLHPAIAVTPPLACRAEDGDCLPAVLAMDGIERSSAADASDLAARETVEIDLPAGEGPSGLVIGARQSLVTTFVLYQTMAWMGKSAGDWVAAMERGGRETAERSMGTVRLLGGIEAEVADGEQWRVIGSFHEAGPISGDVQVIPFSPPTGPLHVRLRMAKGSWRLGYVAVARLLPPLEPRAIPLDHVERGGRVDAAALARLRGDGPRLITVPGDEYRLVFRLPSGAAGMELFLESEGYYYEWMRGEWLAEEDPAMLQMALFHPEAALRRLAGPFKSREARMEAAFWASRFRR
jgi:hypothetical protein